MHSTAHTHSQNPLSKFEERLRGLRLQKVDYERVMELMGESLENGLRAKEDITNDLKMYITYVRSLPDGSEAGNFLALDLGGTNFRVLLISLNNGEISLQSSIYMVPEHIMIGPGVGLFDHIAGCIKSFLEAEGIEKEVLPLGFTFSFPCHQEGLAKSRLVNWTKGFKCSDVEGEDIVKLLEDGLDRQNIKVKCVAVINDTVGTLMSCAHLNRDCQIGLILGTGTNACYVEELDKVEKWSKICDNHPSKQVVINTEWGAFGSNGCLKFMTTEFDKGVDEISINPGEQIYEKMISGMYLGEVARQVIVRLIQDGCLFKGYLSERMNTPMQFFTKYISEIESDNEFELTKVRMVLDEMDVLDYTLMDCLLLREVCQAVSQRAAYLAAAGLAAILKRLNRKFVTIAVDGSLYRYHPHFHNLMTDMIKQLSPDTQFELMLSNDGSGVGAALVAAVSTRQMACVA